MQIRSAPGILRWSIACAAVLAAGAVWPWPAAATEPAGTLAFRLFLKDGTPVATLGECTRAGGRVIFTLPVGLPDAPSSVQLVSLPDHVIDWERTSRYADAVRARRFAETRGEAEFTAMSTEFASMMVQLALTSDPRRRLAFAELARRRLVEWSRTHYAYRAGDIRDMVLAVDDLIADIRSGLGEKSFAFDLVAMTEPPSEPILPDPTLQEAIEQAAAVARVSDVPAERMPLQEAILAVLEPRRSSLKASWVSKARSAVETDLRAERRTELRYADLVRSTLKDAQARAGRGDVEGVDRLVEGLRTEDAKLGGQRPGQMAAAMATLESYAADARRRRAEELLLSQRLDQHAEYRRGTAAVIRALRQVEPDMEAIRALNIPDGDHLAELGGRLEGESLRLGRLTVPSELRAAHESLLTSIRLMQEAIRLCLAGEKGRLPDAAQNASAAAAGAQLLLGRAATDITNFFEAPSGR